MPETEATPVNENSIDAAEFTISVDPVVEEPPKAASQDGTLDELPRSYGGTVLFAMPRDAHTIFTYWDLDWPSIFGGEATRETAIYLRVLTAEGGEESRTSVEPYGGNRYVSVLHSGADYQLELGYEEADTEWHSLARSQMVTTPRDRVSEDATVEVATVPFHLSFERLVGAFRGADSDRKALTNVLSDLQDKAASDALNEGAADLLRAIGGDVSAAQNEERMRLKTIDSRRDALLQQRVEQMLARQAGGSSRSLGGSS